MIELARCFHIGGRVNLVPFHTAAIALVLLAAPPSHATTGPQAQTSVAGVLTAFNDEMTILEQLLTDARSQTLLGIRFVTGNLKGRRVVLASSGVGKVNAAMTATLLVDHFRPDEVLFSGIAGAVNPDLHPGDIVIGERTAQHDMGTLTPDGIQRHGVRNPVNWERSPLLIPADPRLCALAEAAAKLCALEKIQTSEGERTPRIVKGIIVSGDVFVASGAKREELRKALNADAVEMEGAAVAQICWESVVPCLVIRSISDSADANARRDSSLFFAVAAQNSASLVTGIIQQLTMPPTQPTRPK